MLKNNFLKPCTLFLMTRVGPHTHGPYAAASTHPLNPPLPNSKSGSHPIFFHGYLPLRYFY